MLNKNELIKNFVNGNTNLKGSNLYSYMNDKGMEVLVNYSTIIAINHDGIIYLNGEKYSQTTSRNQNLIKRECYFNNMICKIIDESELRYMNR